MNRVCLSINTDNKNSPQNWKSGHFIISISRSLLTPGWETSTHVNENPIRIILELESSNSMQYKSFFGFGEGGLKTVIGPTVDFFGCAGFVQIRQIILGLYIWPFFFRNMLERCVCSPILWRYQIYRNWVKFLPHIPQKISFLSVLASVTIYDYWQQFTG